MRIPTLLIVAVLCAPLAPAALAADSFSTRPVTNQPHLPVGSHNWPVPLSWEPTGPPPVSPGQTATGSVTAAYLSSALWTAMTDVEVEDSLAYCAFWNGLAIIDISDVAAPQWVSSIYLHAAQGTSVTVSKGYAYISQGYAGLDIVDVRDPWHPVLVSTYDTPGYVYRAAVSGHYAYITDLYSLRIVDVSDPAAPSLACQLRLGENIRDVAIVSNYAYASSYFSDLYVVDISDPSNAFVIQDITTVNSPEALLVSGDSLFVFTLGNAGFSVFDISDPASPIFLSSHHSGVVAYEAAMHGSVIAVGSQQEKLRFITLEEPYISDYSVAFDSMEFAKGVASNPAHVFVADFSEGLKIVDYPTPDGVPVLAGEYTVAPWSYGVTVDAGFAYVSCSSYDLPQLGSQNVRVLDVSNPAVPVPLQQFNMSEYIASLDIANDRCYVSLYYSHLRIFNISPTGDLAFAGEDTSVAPGNIAVRDSFAYVANSEGLRILDVSDPMNIRHLGTLTMPLRATKIAVSGQLAYLIDGAALHVVDISDPRVPREVGSLSVYGGAGRLAVSGRFVYLLNSLGVRKVNVTNPAAPVCVGSYDTPMRSAREFAVTGDYALVSDWLLSKRENSAVFVVDMTDASHPVVVDRFTTPGRPFELTVVGQQCYIADESSFLVFSLSLPPAGDMDNTEGISAADLIYLVNYIYKRGPAPQPNPAVGDTNCDGAIDAADIIYLVNYLFRAGPPPGC